MKFKKLLGGGLLATVLALGVGAGLAVHSESEAVSAETTTATKIYIEASGSIWTDLDHVFVHCWGSSIGDVYCYDSSTGLNFITYNNKTYSVWDVVEGAAGFHAYYYKYETWKEAGHTNWITFDSATSTTDNLITVTGGAWDNTHPSHAWGKLDIAENVTVTKHGVCDGDTSHSWVIGTAPAVKGEIFDVPANARLDGYHFGGWFTDPDCLESHRYTAQVLNDDLDLYAKFTTLSKNSYIYYLQDGATNNYVYTWGGENEFGPDGSQGSAITSVSTEVHGVLNFEGKTQYIYKIEFSSEAADTSLKFHYNDWEDETNEMQLVAGAAYWWTGTNADAGAAIDLLLKIEAARNSAQYKGLNYSVCGIDKDVAEGFIDEYDNTLTDEGREFVDGTYTKTYDPSKSASESPSEVQVKYSLIIAKLREIADGTEPNLNTRSISLFGDIDNSTPIMLVVIISVVSLTAVGGYIFLKRRKEN